jgi:hypothetical protein
MVAKKSTTARTPKAATKAMTTKKVLKNAPTRAARLPSTDILPVVDFVELEIVPARPEAEKPKLVRDSFTMPKGEYELLDALKARLLGLSMSVKKSELLRAGVVALATMPDAELRAAVRRIPNLKTGRPKKAKSAAKLQKKRS